MIFCWYNVLKHIAREFLVLAETLHFQVKAFKSSAGYNTNYSTNMNDMIWHYYIWLQLLFLQQCTILNACSQAPVAECVSHSADMQELLGLNLRLSPVGGMATVQKWHIVWSCLCLWELEDPFGLMRKNRAMSPFSSLSFSLTSTSEVKKDCKTQFSLKNL